MRVLSVTKLCGIPCHVLHLWLGGFESLRFYPLSHTPAQLSVMGLWRLTQSEICSPQVLKGPPNNQQKKRKINPGKSDLQLIREMEQGLTPKTSFLLVEQPNPHLGGFHAISLECLHTNTNGKRAFCIFFLLPLMQLNIWETRTPGSFLLMARTYSGGV